MRIDKIKELRKEIQTRTENREQIRERISEFCKSHYGIKDFNSMVDELFGNQDRFGICLSRQVPTVSVQHLAKHLFAKWLTENGVSAMPIALGFEADSFLFANDLKRSYCDIPLLDIFHSGKEVARTCQNRKLIRGKERTELDGKILSKIYIADGKLLIQHHQDLRKQVFGSDRLEIDVSSFFLKCLQKCLDNDAKEKPEYIFVENEKGKEKTITIEKLNGHKVLRPPAEWYYVLYLMFFLDGSRALLSADKHSDKSESLYEKAINAIEEAIGFSPLIISIPKEIELENSYKSKLLEIPAKVMVDSYYVAYSYDDISGRKVINWKEKYIMPGLGFKIGDYKHETTLFEAYEHIAKQLLGETRSEGFS